MNLETENRDAGSALAVREALLGGIGAGVLSGALMLVVLVLSSLRNRHVWWMVPNVLGSTLYGVRALRAGPGFVTLSGVALHLLISGCIGGAFGVACRRIRQARQLTLLALFVALLWHILAYSYIWQRVNPLVALYAAQPSTAIAHALFGLALGRSLRAFTKPPAPPSPEAPEAIAETIESPPLQALDDYDGPLEPAPPKPLSGSSNGTNTAAEGPVRLE